MLEKFPFMKGVDVQYQWGGRVGVTFDFLPVVGMTGECNNIYYAMDTMAMAWLFHSPVNDCRYDGEYHDRSSI